MHRAAGAVLLGLLTFAGGCSDPVEVEHGVVPPAFRETEVPPAPPPRVTRDDGGIAGCGGPRRAARTLMRFFDAYNRGDVAGLRGIVAPAGRFGLFWTGVSGRVQGPQLGATGRIFDDFPRREGRDRVFPWFAARHGERERIFLISTAVSDLPPGSWFVHLNERAVAFVYTARRQADDLARLGGRNRIQGGKGAVSCRDGKLIALAGALMTNRRYVAAPDCPGESRADRVREPPRAVACTAP